MNTLLGGTFLGFCWRLLRRGRHISFEWWRQIEPGRTRSRRVADYPEVKE